MKPKAGNGVVRASGPTASLQDVVRALVVDLCILPEELERSLWKDEEEEFKNRGLVHDRAAQWRRDSNLTLPVSPGGDKGFPARWTRWLLGQPPIPDAALKLGLSIGTFAMTHLGVTADGALEGVRHGVATRLGQVPPPQGELLSFAYRRGLGEDVDGISKEEIELILGPFSAWLLGRVRPKTIKMLRSHARAVITFTGTPSPKVEALRAFEHHRGDAWRFRSAWRHFVRYCKDRRLKYKPAEMTRGDSRGEVDPPTRVKHAIVTLGRQVPHAKLLKAQWRDYNTDLKQRLFEVELDEAGVAALGVLFAWAGSPAGRHPLIPAAPGSAQAMPNGVVRRILRDFNAFGAVEVAARREEMAGRAERGLAELRRLKGE